MATVYILRSIKTNKYYIGSTNNLEQRVKAHAAGRVRSTKAFRPFEIALEQTFETVSKAKKIEYRLKRLKRKDYIEKIIKEGLIKMGL